MNLITATLLVTVAVLNVSALYVNVDKVGVYNGTSIGIISAPFMAALLSKRGYKCGASIIDEQFLLTSAHCVPQNASEYTIHTGSQKLDEKIIYKNIYNVSKIIRHNLFSTMSEDYDIALIKLPKKMNFKDALSYENKTDLPTSNFKLPESANLNIYGWGTIGNGSYSNYLLKAQVPTISKWNCRSTYGEKVTSRMICTFSEKGGFCDGDSGGPATYNNTQVGIISFVDSDCKKNPQVYTYLPPLISWVYENMERNR